MPIYKNARRSKWIIGIGLFLYDHLAGPSVLPKSKWLSADELISKDPNLKSAELEGGYEFSDGQMDDYALGLWAAEQAITAGATISEQSEIISLTKDGKVTTASGGDYLYDCVINVAGPWALSLLKKSNIELPYKLDLVRGSHVILGRKCSQAYLLEVPNSRRVVFVLPWKENTLLGTTEIRQKLEDKIECSEQEETYLLNAWNRYFLNQSPIVIGKYAGLRPLVSSAKDPNKATREYAIHRSGKILTVLGGKWTTALALANKVAEAI
jgi:glycerol-3-phosphate dehydrogenase